MAELTAAPTVEPSEVATVEQTAAPMAELTVGLTAELMGVQTAGLMGVQTAGPMVAQTVAPLAEDSVLSRLIAVDRNQFASQYWGRQPLLSPAADLPGGFPQLFDANAIDELVSQRGLRTPFLRVAKNGTTLGDKAFTSPGGVGAGIADQVSEDRLVRLFADGSTLVLQALHRVWPPILQFCQELAAELGHPVQANAYVTPPQNQGFSAHYDVHDVFVLQIAGEKRWRVHPPVLVSPLRDQPWNDRKADVEKRAEEPPLIEAVLTPGDSLYLPRGYLHAATALGGVSTHLTLGIHVWTRFALAQQVIEQALRTVSDDPVIRASLPLGVDVSDPSEMSPDFDVVTAILADAVENADLDQMSQSLLQNARLSQRAAPVGPLRQLHDADAITVDTQIALRRHLAASVDHSGSQILVRSRAGDLPVAEDDVGRLKALLTDGVATAGDLGVDLARRLLLAGLAIVE
ncbi:MAG TPA: cupin domain-containing protein [Propionibacteriaceae bacterium]|nr:cupin domain-containing protein [Propionibacteriaceae bacterium]